MEKQNENVDIIIATHKHFDCPNNKIWLPISMDEKCAKEDGFICCNSGDNIFYKQRIYSELVTLYWYWKNYEISDYVGLCQYSKIFNFGNGIPNISYLLNDNNSAIVTNGIKVDSPLSLYGNNANVEDIKLLIRIFKSVDKINGNDFKKYMNERHCFFPNNIFIMDKWHLNEYCNMLFPLLKKWEEQMNLNTIEDYEKYVLNNKDKYLENRYNGFLFNQTRMPAAMAEYITSYYIIRNFDTIISFSCNGNQLTTVNSIFDEKLYDYKEYLMNFSNNVKVSGLNRDY